jgi:Domain of unknown function (DUF4178)
MKLDNPTQIRIGMTGSFFGRTYHVAGRAVLGELEDGEIYYWNEFNLETDTGEAGTLVYEETERGGEWRWFTLFEPEFPITAADAATKEVGDPVNLDGTDVKVTLVRESRVYHVEGKAPEGEHVGSRANYFNAEAGQKMVVVSWTGDEVECYHGVTIRTSLVAAAFNLKSLGLIKFNLTGGAGLSSPRITRSLWVVPLVSLVIFVVLLGWQQGRRPPATVKYSAPDSPLKLGSSGRLDGTNYHVVGHAEVEIALVGSSMVRHEFHLRDDDGGDAWLIFGSRPGENDCLLCTPLHPLALLTPQMAARVRLGEMVNVENVAVQITAHFRSTIRHAEEQNGEAAKPGDVRYGFIGRHGNDILLVRWDERQMECYHGRPLQAQVVTSAFR